MSEPVTPPFDYGWTIIEIERRIAGLVNRMSMLEAFCRNLDDQIASIDARITALENQ